MLHRFHPLPRSGCVRLLSGQPLLKPAMTKIVATIGPASEQLPMLQKVVTAGMRIMRINFSHATFEEADLRVKNLRLSAGSGQAAAAHGSLNLRAVMLDTQGPEIRTGSFAGGVKEVELCADDEVRLSVDPALRSAQTKELLWVSYLDLSSTVQEGSSVLLDDGAIELKVLRVSPEGVQCRVANTGVLGNKKGVNIPGHVLTLPAMSDKDRVDFKWGVDNDVDYIAASFTRRASDVVEIRDYIRGLQREAGFPETHPVPLIISKIESTEALDNLDEIIRESDGIMVARGDLGVEIPMETLTNWQKDIVRRCNLAGKPVIVATQMLESMQKSPRPTRAECTDVANAVFDGADCVMLSGESAKGRYPVQSVAMMQRIVEQSEQWAASSEDRLTCKSGCDTLREGVAHAVVEASRSLQARCIIVHSHSGDTARDIAKYRPHVPILAFAHTQKVGRMLQLYRGVHPLVLPPAEEAAVDLDPGSFGSSVLELERAVALGFCKAGDTVILVSGERGREGSVLGSTVSMRVAHVQRKI